MTKPKVNTPISDEEAEEWAERMIDTEEDLGFTGDTTSWQEFVSSKLMAQTGLDATLAQLDRLSHIGSVISKQMGFRTEFHAITGVTMFRDLTTGRFMSRDFAKYRYSFFKGLL